MESLLQKQIRFSGMAANFIQHIQAQGYQVTLGDAYRDSRVFGIMGERKGYGESRSTHKHRLAIDLNLFKDGRFLANTEDHKPFGEYWESVGGSWGGRFQDGNHYSLEHEGIK